MYYRGATLICLSDFFIFEKNQLYYCTHEDEKYFYVWNKDAYYNVCYIKLPKSLIKKFKIQWR